MDGAHDAPDTGPVLAIYREALPVVFGYLLPRCGDAAVAEDLTAETFLAAVAAVRNRPAPTVTIGWLVGVARHKLVDHWRRQGRQQHGLAVVQQISETVEDPWDELHDTEAAYSALRQLSPNHRAALTLRYLDDLSVPEVADFFGRSVRATETLLVRARAALRAVYDEGSRR